MKPTATLIAGLGLFLIPWTVIYWLAAHEHGGATALLATVIALLFLAAYLAWAGRHTGDRPEDRDADPEEGAGEVGVFPARSPWPAVLGVAAALTGFFLVFSRWLALTGLMLLLLALAGMAMESERARQ
ncbi:MAG: aa3-type cytochrome oxidase subunit IV [Acidimicrobiia bacterium]